MDGIFEFLHGLENATPEALVCEVGEEALYSILARKRMSG